MTTTPAHQRFWQWLKNFPKRHKFITALVLLYVLWKAIMTPIPNPFAKDAITVRLVEQKVVWVFEL
jgi:hypothetical protein